MLGHSAFDVRYRLVYWFVHLVALVPAGGDVQGEVQQFPFLVYLCAIGALFLYSFEDGLLASEADQLKLPYHFPFLLYSALVDALHHDWLLTAHWFGAIWPICINLHLLLMITYLACDFLPSTSSKSFSFRKMSQLLKTLFTITLISLCSSLLFIIPFTYSGSLSSTPPWMAVVFSLLKLTTFDSSFRISLEADSESSNALSFRDLE